MSAHRVPTLGAVDVHYPGSGGAWAALVVATGPHGADIVEQRVHRQEEAAAYQPGSFWVRELGPILAVLAGADEVDLVIVDGYVDLDPQGRPGLGARLHERIRLPVVGVAKSLFRGATHAVAVRRGSGTRPLYITAAGIDLDRAARLVTDLAGAHRIPDLLRRVDRLARTG